MPNIDTDKAARTRAATVASARVRSRKRQDRLASELRRAGWLAVPPEEADQYAVAYDEASHRATHA